MDDDFLDYVEWAEPARQAEQDEREAEIVDAADRLRRDDPVTRKAALTEREGVSRVPGGLIKPASRQHQSGAPTRSHVPGSLSVSADKEAA